jgi:isopenicillin N synthase-like dioxygenase
MLERMSGGRFVSNPHRVRNTADRFRVSFPLFLDPAWDARIEPLPASVVVRASRMRAAAAAVARALLQHVVKATCMCVRAAACSGS